MHAVAPVLNHCSAGKVIPIKAQPLRRDGGRVEQPELHNGAAVGGLPLSTSFPS